MPVIFQSNFDKPPDSSSWQCWREHVGAVPLAQEIQPDGPCLVMRAPQQSSGNSSDPADREKQALLWDDNHVGEGNPGWINLLAFTLLGAIVPPNNWGPRQQLNLVGATCALRLRFVDWTFPTAARLHLFVGGRDPRLAAGRGRWCWMMQVLDPIDAGLLTPLVRDERKVDEHFADTGWLNATVRLTGEDSDWVHLGYRPKGFYPLTPQQERDLSLEYGRSTHVRDLIGYWPSDIGVLAMHGNPMSRTPPPARVSGELWIRSVTLTTPDLTS